MDNLTDIHVGYNVLNLVISGIPSILISAVLGTNVPESFKPCYKWNTFNTIKTSYYTHARISFKPCYKWNTFNTWKKAQQYSSDIVEEF